MAFHIKVTFIYFSKFLNSFSFSFALMQKKQNSRHIGMFHQDNPIRPGVCPARARQKPIVCFLKIYKIIKE
jgi:hypothetical protein